MPITERLAAELPATIKNADYNLIVDDVGREIQFDSAVAVNANLLPVSEAGNGYNVILRNIGSGNLTIDPHAGEMIDGATTKVLSTGQSIWIRSDATTWKSVASTGQGSGSGGAVLQVVESVYAGAEETTTSSTWADTSLSATITPSSTTSKILCMASLSVLSRRTASATTLSRLVAGQYGVFRGNSATGTLVVNKALTLSDGGLQNFWELQSEISLQKLDAPATTSAQTYTVAFNGPMNDVEYICTLNGFSFTLPSDPQSSLILMEIAGS